MIGPGKQLLSMTSLRIRLSGHRQLLRLVYKKPLDLGGLGPVVSFAFDDFPRSAYTEGGNILRTYDGRGTYYAAAGLANQVTAFGENFRLEDLYSLTAEGHELATHTNHHVSAHELGTEEYVREVLEGVSALQRNPGLKVSGNFAYPFGRATAASKREVGKEMRSCRGTLPGINGAITDLNFLSANALYGDESSLGSATGMVDAAEQGRHWLIFYTHDVQPSPSPYGCTPGLLEAAVKMVSKRGIKICTVDEVLSTAQQS